MNDNNIGIISITNEGNVSFSFRDFYIEVFGSRQLTQLLSVKEFNNETGYFVLSTNYGEEFYCLEETLEDMGLMDKIMVKEKLQACAKWMIL